MKSLFAPLLAASLLSGCSLFQAEENYPADIARLDTGVIKGSITDGVVAFKGIPYAEAPVGDLRWRAPQPVAAWQGVREATEFGNDCMQTPFPSDAAPLGEEPAEDCLYINVWKPDTVTSADKLPVMVWIYGGGFVNGGSSPAVYDGAALAQQGVVLISMNYRLGRFGFFGHPALTAAQEDDLAVNYGYMDQLAALRWVQNNAASFGGDPDNVTIFGESAGGVSVHTLMTTPLAKGLFDKAIVMSGGGRPNGLMSGATITSAEQAGQAFAAWAGIEGSDKAALEALRALPAEKLALGVGMGAMFAKPDPAAPPMPSGPVADGKLVLAGASGNYDPAVRAQVPFMAGANTMDIGFPGPDFFSRFGDQEDHARQLYLEAVGGNEKMMTYIAAADATMVEPARYSVEQMHLAGQPAWHYRAAYVPESMRAQWPGLPHAAEIPFFFKTIDARYPGDVAEQDRDMAKVMSAYFVNFAKTGNPNGEGLPDWPAYDEQSRPLMLFGNEGAQGGDDPWRERLDLIEASSGR